VGRAFAEVFPGLDAQGIPLLLDKVYRAGQTVSSREIKLSFGPGREETYWNSDRVPLRNLDGAVDGVLILVREVTREVLNRQWTEALGAKAQRHGDELDAILKAMPEAVVVFDTEGTIVQTNPVTEALGIGPVGANAVLVARRVKRRYADGRLIPPEELAFAIGLRGDVLLDRPEIVDSPAGEQREVLTSAAPVVSEGKIVASVVVTHDVTEQRQAEKERERLLAENRTQREFLERLLEAAPVGIAVLRGEDHRYELANPYYRAGTTGSADTPMVGHTMVEMIPDLVKRRMPELMDQVYRTGQTVSTREVQLTIGPEGRETYWNTDRVPLRGPDGTVEGILVLAQEVTAQVLDRRRIEALSAEAQRQADEREAIFTSLVEPAMVFDTTGAILRANPAAQEWLGVDPVGLPEVVLGQQMSARYPDGRPIPGDDLVAMRALRGERVRDDYQLLLTPTGEHAIVASAAPIITGGRCSGAVISWHDITDLQEAEDALRESEAKLRALFDVLPIGVVVLDEKLRVVRENRALASIVRPSPQALGRWNHRASGYLYPDGTPMPPEELPSARALRDQRLVQGEVGIVTDDGPVTWQEINAVPVPFGDWKAVVTVADVTERKRAEEAIRRARDELEQRVRERTIELENANQKLLAEIRQRMRVEGELRLSEQRLEQRVEERTRVLTSLLDISNTVALSIDLEALLALILERLKDVVDYDGGAAFRLEGGTLNPVFHRGAISADDLLEIGSHLEEAAVGHATISGVERVILADVQGEPALREAFRQAAGSNAADLANTVRAWMTVPVTIKQQVYGVLYMYHSQPGRYSEEEARLALPFGNQTALAIENTRIYEQAAELAAVEERQRLARELHDAVTQTLFSASLAADVLPRLWERNREAGLNCLSEVHQLTRGALAEMRTLLLELRPAALVETELKALLSQLAEAVTSRARIPVTVQAVPHCILPPEVQVALYRIAQEALNNVAKHAAATHAEVIFQSTPTPTSEEGQPYATAVELSVADDGRGFEPTGMPDGCKGLGLGIMRERAEAIGAAFEISSRPGQGTHVTVRWLGDASDLFRPLPSEGEAQEGTLHD
jgi:PAS domain S-box-containing protein